MRGAITFRDQAEHEDCENEQHYPFFGGSEAQSLPHFVESETAGLLNQVADPPKWLLVKIVDYYPKSVGSLTNFVIASISSKSA